MCESDPFMLVVFGYALRIKVRYPKPEFSTEALDGVVPCRLYKETSSKSAGGPRRGNLSE